MKDFIGEYWTKLEDWWLGMWWLPRLVVGGVALLILWAMVAYILLL